MSVRSVKIDGANLDIAVVKVTYNTNSSDLTVHYADGSSFKYLDVPSNIMTNLEALIADKVDPKSVIDYLYASALTEGGMNGKVPKYHSVVVSGVTKEKLANEQQGNNS